MVALVQRPALDVCYVSCVMIPAGMPHSSASQLLCNPSFRTSTMSYSALTALVYFAFLRDIGHDDGLERRADQILHYVTPALFFVDWLLIVPRGYVAFRAIPRFLIYPALYVAWT